MNVQNKQYQDARALYCSHSYGVLSTHSSEMEGYPFGSIVPYCLDYSGEPLILISDIAQHTKNINLSAKVSLTIFKATDGIDPQSSPRLTYLAQAKKIAFADEPASYERYYRNLPHTSDYHKTHDFNLYRLECVRGRYIGGFGKIFWIEKNDLLEKNPFSPQDELEIINHMNQDHQKALSKYVAKAGMDSENKQIELCGIDSSGIDLLLNKEKKVRILLPFPVSNMDEARKALVELSKI